MRYLAAVLLLGCASIPVRPTGIRPGNGTAYETLPDAMTPGGVKVRTNGHDIDLEAIDEAVEAVRACAGPFETAGITVVIAPDAVTDFRWRQSFPCYTPNPERCQGIVQRPGVVIVTPNLRVLRHELIHLAYDVRENSPLMRCE